jgi:hypothetical protein
MFYTCITLKVLSLCIFLKIITVLLDSVLYSYLCVGSEKFKNEVAPCTLRCSDFEM